MGEEVELSKSKADKPDLSSEKNDQFIEFLRKLVNESIKYNRQRSKLIDEFLKQKMLKGKFSFRFPFILKEEHINSFNECIIKRLDEIYTEYDLEFLAHVEYKNNDKLIYQGIKDFFEATHEEPMLRISLHWKYTITECFDGIDIPVPYEIIIVYEVEQDSDQKELYRLEEWGGVLVEGNSNDWINATLSKLKTLIKSTKMPFWWYYPKKVFLYMRDYTNYLIFTITFILASIGILPLFSGDAKKIDFIERSRQITDISQKLQAFIEYSLAPSDTSNNLILYILLLYAISGGLTLLFTKLNRHVFPQSMILIGNMKAKQKNILIAYSFVWGAILTTIIGIVLSIIF